MVITAAQWLTYLSFNNVPLSLAGVQYQYENHMRMLYQENQTYLERFREKQRDRYEGRFILPPEEQKITIKYGHPLVGNEYYAYSIFK